MKFAKFSDLISIPNRQGCSSVSNPLSPVRFVIGLTTVAIVLASMPSTNCVAETNIGSSIKIAITPVKGELLTVKARYDITGQVATNDAGGNKEVKQLPLDVRARLEFDQRFNGSATTPQAIRHFRTAKAEIKVAGGKTLPQLTAENNYVLARVSNVAKTCRLQVASIGNFLQQSEYDLIRNPCDPLTYPRVFNTAKAKVGQKWSPTHDSLADFLNVDRVIASDVQLLLKDVTGGQAKLYMLGAVEADVDDVETSIEVSGTIMIDLKSNLVKELRMTIRENREPGSVAPGFNGQEKIDIKIQAARDIQSLSPQAVAKNTKAKKIARKLKWNSKAGDFGVVFDGRWRLIASESEAAVMRYLDEGNVLAQCNIVQLPSRPAGSEYTLLAFKKHVANLIQKSKAAKVVDSKTVTTASNDTALRISVEGVEEGLPVNWIYYHVMANDGRRVTFVFTLEKEIANRFLPADVSLVKSLVFNPISKANQKAASKKAATAKKPSNTQSSRKSR